jgi:hypothetical protein
LVAKLTHQPNTVLLIAWLVSLACGFFVFSRHCFFEELIIKSLRINSCTKLGAGLLQRPRNSGINAGGSRTRPSFIPLLLGLDRPEPATSYNTGSIYVYDSLHLLSKMESLPIFVTKPPVRETF